MNVYVESNFVLEQALEQEQHESCQRLIDISAAGSVRLLIPAFSLAEPHITLMHKASERKRLRDELQRQLSELGRSKSYRDASSSFNEITGLLIKSAENERDGLERAVDSILKSADVIPLDADVLGYAGTIRNTFDLSMQDSLVLSSVIRHLADTKPVRSCFLNRNTKDFDDPNVRETLEEFDCRFFGRFDHAVDYIEAQLRNPE